MKTLAPFIILVLLAGACASPAIEAVDSTPTLFTLETATAITPTERSPDEPGLPDEVPSTRLDVTAFPNPGSTQWVLVAGDFRRPLAMTHAGDQRLFVVEQEGVVWIIEDDQRLPDPFLDIRARVNDNANEQGLLGLAFHPNYAETGYFYVNYTGAGGATRISRFTRSQDPNLADGSSELILLTIDQPYANHNGGAVNFGPDGYLYLGLGDGGSGGDPLGNGQRLDTLLGKILRLDVEGAQPYNIPSDNPFAQGGGLPEIWGYGLRNPWRIAFDPSDGDLFIADVGQNQWEEINHQAGDSPGGENYGWNLREGAHTYSPGEANWVDPVAEYDHSAGCSVTGGEVVRDPLLSDWAGIYLYGDYCSGRIWGLLDTDQGWLTQLLYESNFTISSFGRDSHNRIYLTDHRGGLYRLEATP